MRTPTPLPAEAMEELATLLQQGRTSAEYRRVECVWLRALLGLSAAQIATVLGWHISSVSDLHSRSLRAGVTARQGPGRGGRHRQHLSLAPEQELLTQFNEVATQGGLWEARTVRDAYRKILGHPVAKSTVYRLLARHGWRKLAPRPRHPKADPSVQKVFKKSDGAWWLVSAHGGPPRACACASCFRRKRVLG
jgi:transposase